MRWCNCSALLHVVIFGGLVHRPQLVLRVTWIATGVLLFYLHYTAALLFVAEIVYYALVWILARFPLAGASGLSSSTRWRFGFPFAAKASSGRSFGYRWTQLVTDVILLGLGLLPAVPHLREIAQRRQDWSSFVPARSLVANLGDGRDVSAGRLSPGTAGRPDAGLDFGVDVSPPARCGGVSAGRVSCVGFCSYCAGSWFR